MADVPGWLDDIGHWFGGIFSDINNVTLGPLEAWSKDLGAKIGAGIESGIIGTIKDIWDVIIGPLEILVGAAILIVTFSLAFKDDLMSVAAIVARGAA